MSLLAAAHRRNAGGASPVHVGYDVIGGSTATLSATAIVAGVKFTAPFTGTISEIDFYCACSNAGLDVKVGLYADSGGSPSSRVGTETEFLNIGTFSAQWKNFNGLSLPVTSGLDYWLAIICSSASTLTFNFDTTGAGRKSDNHSYGTAWPATFTVDSSSGAQYSLRALLNP